MEQWHRMSRSTLVHAVLISLHVFRGTAGLVMQLGTWLSAQCSTSEVRSFLHGCYIRSRQLFPWANGRSLHLAPFADPRSLIPLQVPPPTREVVLAPLRTGPLVLQRIISKPRSGTTFSLDNSHRAPHP